MGFPPVTPTPRGGVRALGEGALRWPTRVQLPSLLAPVEPVKCSIETMCQTIPAGRRISDETRFLLGDTAYAQFDAMFLRDTAHELYAAHLILLDTARLQWSAPLGEGCRFPLVGESGGYEGHLVRLAVAWERDGERMVLFPQVSVQVEDIKPRVDYLVVHSAPATRPQGVVLELDGSPHTYQTRKDATRTLKLPFPVVRFDNSAVCLPGFLPWLLGQVRDRAAYARASNDAYRDFLDDRRARVEKLRNP